LRWIVIDPWAFWAAILAPFGALLLAWALPAQPEFRVRLAGYIVTLFGVILVANGIRQTQQMFGQAKVWDRVVAWGRRLLPIFRRPKPIHGTGTSTLGALSVSGTGTVRVVAEDSSSIESRIDAVEENLRRIDARITSSDKERNKQINDMREALSAEKSARADADNTLGKRLETISIGNLDWEIVGGVWVIFGQALGAFPPEIAAILLSV
jgi:hypothetical protein